MNKLTKEKSSDFKNTYYSEIDLKIENERIKKDNLMLKKQLEESRAMSWILSEVIKASGTLVCFESLMENITDILMGVLGLDTCTIWIKKEENYLTYSRSIYNGNKYEVKDNENLPEFLLKIKETSSFDVGNRKSVFFKGENVESILIAPLEDFRDNNRFGSIIVEHRNKNFFNKNTIDFFNILAIQVGIAVVNSKLFEKINEVSNKDVLTNCYNRNYLEKLMLNMNVKQENYTLAVFDLDNFKGVNDTCGHEKGDELIIEVSNLAIDIAKNHNGDVIRYGGDEFVIILFKPLNEAVEILEIFRERIPGLKVIKESKVYVTVTIGVASYPETVVEMRKVFTAADMALIKGKKKGLKNRIHIGYCNTIQQKSS